MATIQQDLAAIRTAVYGKDVREAIADGIENCYNESAQSGYTQLNGRMAAAEDNIQTLLDNVDAMIGTDSALVDRMTTAENSIDSLTEGQNILGVDISAVSGRVDATENSITALEKMTEPTRNRLYVTGHTTPGSFKVQGVTVTVNDDGSLSFDGTVTGSDGYIPLMGCTSKDDYRIASASTYIFGRKTVNASGNGSIHLRYDYASQQNNTIALDQATTFSSNASIYLRLPRGQAYTSTGKYYYWAESGSTLHEYVPYGKTGVDSVARETMNDAKELLDILIDDTTEMSRNLFYFTANPEPTDGFVSLGSGLYYRINADGSASFYGTATATVRLPLMGCTSTSDYSVAGNRYLTMTRKLVSGNYSGNIPVKYDNSAISATTFPLETPVQLTENSALYLQIASGATFGTIGNPSTIRWQITEGEEVQTAYVPYNQYVAKDTYARNGLEELDERVDARIDDLETANLPAIDRLPAYYHTNNYIEDKITSILNRAGEIKTSKTLGYQGSGGQMSRSGEVKKGYDAFAFITDMHLWWIDRGVSSVEQRNNPPVVETINGMQSVKLLEAIRERANVTKIFNGGDMLRGSFITLDTLKEYLGKAREFLDPVWDDTYFCIGNHEWNNPGSNDTQNDDMPSFTMLYQMFVADKADRYGSISELGDYWIDNEAEQIRYFVIHCSHGSFIYDLSITWFAEQMLEVPDGYTVVLITHNVSSLDDWDSKYTASFAKVAAIIDAARNRTTFTFGTVTYDYKYAKYNIACVLTGHTHADRFQYIPRDDTNGVPVICTTSDHWGQNVGNNGRNPGTVTEQAFDIVQLDTSSRKVWLTRIGGVSGTVDRVFGYPAGVNNGEVKPSEVVLADQGVAQAGKALVVGEDGRVTTGDAGIPEAVKKALLDIFQHVAYVDEQGSSLFSNLNIALDGGLYNTYVWELNTEGFEMISGGCGIGDTISPTRAVHYAGSNLNIRRSLTVNRGISPYYERDTHEILRAYPIPVPSDAGQCVIMVTPAQQCNCHIVKYVGDGYTIAKSTGWIDTSTTFYFEASSSQFLVVALRVDQNNDQYDELTIPTEVTIRFDRDDFYNRAKWSMSSGELTMIHAGVNTNQSNTNLYPSRINVQTNYDARRTFFVAQGKAPYYVMSQTAVATSYYPIPVPSWARKYKLTMTPNGRFVYIHFVQYDEATGTYGDSITENRVQWTQLTNGVLSNTITNPGNMFMVVNSKYDSSGQSYPTDPSDLVVEFMEG